MINKNILEKLDDELRKLKEEILNKEKEISNKEIEIEESGDYEVSDYELDDYINDCCDEVDIIGIKYPMSNILKIVDKWRYENMRDDFSYRIEERRAKLETELDDLKEELKELKDNYEEEFENE